jgi:hypothetical protein
VKTESALDVPGVAEKGLGSSAPQARKARRDLAFAAGLLALAAVYFGAAKLGLALAFQAEQVTAVWPPTGIALAAVLLFGYRASGRELPWERFWPTRQPPTNR